MSAILVESITNALKPIWDETKRGISYTAVVPLMVGVIIALAADLDLFGIFGLDITWPLVPQMLTGIVISRGANFVYDLISRVQNGGGSASSGNYGGDESGL